MNSQLTDTLVANPQVVENIAGSGEYNYEMQLAGKDPGIMDAIWSVIDSWFRGTNQAINSTPKWVWEMVAVVALCVIAYLFYVNRNAVFAFTRRRKKLDYSIEEDDINTIDFEAGIAQALATGDYRNACRLVYLKTLKSLSDSKAIDWKLFKTPNQYVAEVHDTQFRLLTNHFLRIRYGDFDATRPLYDEMLALHHNVVSSHVIVGSEEGGEQS